VRTLPRACKEGASHGYGKTTQDRAQNGAQDKARCEYGAQEQAPQSPDGVARAPQGGAQDHPHQEQDAAYARSLMQFK
jgi:hypothetical protein